ncbi:hypothetical protein VTL71DRAFT_15772, partial [Oculimacula yallundae]
INLLPWP